MPNKRRTARRPVKRRTGKQREHQTGFVGKLLIMLAVVAAIVLGVAIFFRVSTVEVQGNKIYSAQQIIDVSEVEKGDNLLTVNRSAINARIRVRMPYVQDSSVGLLLPDTIVIKVVESQVAGLVKADVGTDWYVNTEGRILGSSVTGFQGQIVELSGFTITAPAAGQQAVPSDGMADSMTAALSVLQELEGSGLLEMIDTIDAEKSFDIRLLCGEQYEVRLGGSDSMDYKIWYLQEVLQKLDSYQTGIIDLTTIENGESHFIPWE